MISSLPSTYASPFTSTLASAAWPCRRLLPDPSMWMTSVSMTAGGVKHYIAEDGDEHDRTQVPKVVDHNVSASKHFDIVRSRIVGRRTV